MPPVSECFLKSSEMIGLRTLCSQCPWAICSGTSCPHRAASILFGISAFPRLPSRPWEQCLKSDPLLKEKSRTSTPCLGIAQTSPFPPAPCGSSSLLTRLRLSLTSLRRKLVINARAGDACMRDFELFPDILLEGLFVDS